ncbi:TonB-dependent receptor domain-containing protein [Thiomicrorhabdus sp. 6S3-12]|uniref:TonB-dependent receptor domain-containing protein n=1 Tax=Thiomicrorhabdus sp. 6S3-12 TaxID=2819681 RepID=UPI001AADE8EC|nr:TonB-dependent receptor [Thiomicrorhabdus sp. 6S3-12]MBO1924088.1 TonB-dependent receptor [Thiomicrorhabdus sp. 6S3-12]
MKFSKRSSALLIALFSNTAVAEQKSSLLETIFVSETPVISDNLQTAYSVESYDAKSIQESGSRSLSDFLNQKTTLSVQPSYGNPLAPRLDMNGFGTNGGENIQVIIDGVSINNIDLVPQQLSSIPLNAIQEIQILRGSGSVLYGNGAVAGAIIINTNQAFNSQDALSATVSYGANNTVTKSFQATKTETHKGYKLLGNMNFETLKSDGSKEIKSDGTRNSIENTNFSTNLGIEKAGTRLILGIAKNDSTVNYAGAMSIDEFEQNPDANLTSGSTEQTYDVISKKLLFSSELSDNSILEYTFNRRNKNSAYITYSSETDYEITDHKLDLKTILNSALIRYGVSKNTSEVEGTYGDKSREDQAAYVSASIDLNDKTVVNAGYRKQQFEYADKNEGDDDLNAYEVGVNYLLNVQSALYATYNHAFLVPNFDRLFEGGSFNDNIEPQESDTYTLGYKLNQQAFNLKAELFYIDLSNEIYYNSALPWGSRNTNIDESHKQGVNLSLSRSDDAFSYGVAYNYVDAVIDREAGQDYSGNTLPSAPAHTIKLDARYQFTSPLISALPQHSIAISHKQTSESFMIDDFANVADKAPGYKTTDISYQLSNKYLTVQFGIDNLFDEPNGLYLYRSTGSVVYATDYERYYYVSASYQF